jgi:NAD-dependent dihydropyrimidine dehydrogenase PreA subunit/flavodoxin
MLPYVSIISYLCNMIFYFSGTGNTRWAAQQVAAATQEKLLFIPEELQTSCEYTLQDDERIGFCFPVHGWQPPHIVRTFISRLLITNAAGHYAYAICSCGDSTGLAMTMFRDELAARGIALGSCQSLIMPESYVCLPFMYTDTPEREAEKKETARHDLEEYIKVVNERRTGYSQLTLGMMPWTLSHVIGAYFNRFMITDKKFTVDTDLCTHCGRCARECPVGDIVFDKMPQWKNDSSCTCCLSCYHHCPVHAINYGRITRKRGQYYFDKP